MLDALTSGTNGPEILGELAKGTLRKKIPALREALQGRFTRHHPLLIGQMLAQIASTAAQRRRRDARDRRPTSARHAAAAS